MQKSGILRLLTFYDSSLFSVWCASMEIGEILILKENWAEILITTLLVQLLRNAREYMNRSILLSNFCLYGCIFVLKDSAFKPWKVIYLNNLSIIRLFFSMWIKCLCPSAWLKTWLLAAGRWQHEQNTWIVFLDTLFLQILISLRVCFFNLLGFWQCHFIFQHKDFTKTLVYLYSWWFND